MVKKSKRIIWWVRRDIRLTDNQALSAALVRSNNILPLFILDPRLLQSQYVGPKRTAFLFGALNSLDHDLRQIGSRLIVLQGEPEKVLPSFFAESESEAVFAEEDISPFARRRDARVQELLPLILTGGLTVHPPEMVMKGDGTPYTVFTPFSKAWKALPAPDVSDLLAKPESLEITMDWPSVSIPETQISTEIPFVPSELEAAQRLKRFTEKKIFQYGQHRNRPDLAGTSGLSPYLRFGMLSMRQAVVTAWEAMARPTNQEGRKGAETWLNELIWREFFISILYHFPHVRQGSFRSKYEDINWENDREKFAAWCAGRTGYPIVDAGMRQLVQSGWMHNRVRMITASFLVKDLLIDWRWGEKWFMQHLIDGDPAANNGGWQWTAGTGTDAAPYFRIFNPILQGKRFDPHGHYIRRWVPELHEVPEEKIHEPWRMSGGAQEKAGCLIGENYPQPIVDHAAARQRALALYKREDG